MSKIQVRRMARELDLLSTSPPPGVAAWPSTGPDGDSSRIDLLDGEIVGASETPYAGGVFRLRIAIPPEYPMKPPGVRFVTKIYHPNIDAQGRICLDTLNMPPKGAWKPSLNVSTVLASVQLLMSHPNPDDGLMADITDEYRRFPERFQATARDWTKRHANGEAERASAPEASYDGSKTVQKPLTPKSSDAAGSSAQERAECKSDVRGSEEAGTDPEIKQVVSLDGGKQVAERAEHEPRDVEESCNPVAVISIDSPSPSDNEQAQSNACKQSTSQRKPLQNGEVSEGARPLPTDDDIGGVRKSRKRSSPTHDKIVDVDCVPSSSADEADAQSAPSRHGETGRLGKKKSKLTRPAAEEAVDIDKSTRRPSLDTHDQPDTSSAPVRTRGRLSRLGKTNRLKRARK